MNVNPDWLERRLQGEAGPVIIDGGMGTELQRAGVAMDQRVWSGRAVLTHPEAVRAAHEAFLRAGAEVILTNTFASARHMLEPGGLGDEVTIINRRAVELAQAARQNAAAGPAAIAGSICEWAHADDSRWNHPEAVYESVQEQAGLLVDAGVDLLALEMCQQAELTRAALDAALAYGLPLWLGFSARRFDGREGLSAFDYAERDFADLVEAFAAAPVQLIAIMHTPVNDVPAALEVLRRYWSGPVAVYPESGYFTMPDWHFIDIIPPEALLRQARDWVAAGVRAVGGCCGIGPEHIAALSDGFAAGTSA